MARYGVTSTKNILSWSWGSSVATVTRLLDWKIEDLRFYSHQGQDNIHFSVVFRPALGPIEHLQLQHVSRSMKPTFQTYLVDTLRISYTYTLSCVFMAVCVIQRRDKVIIHIIRYFIVSVLMETLGCTASRNFSFFSLFHFNKTNRRTNFPNLFLSRNSTCFGQFVCPSSGVYSLYTQQWFMSYSLVDSFQARPGRA
jgi:hypothetical protein